MPRRIAYIIPLLIGLILAAVYAAGIYADKERHAQKSRLEVFYKLSAVEGGFENGLNTRLQPAEAIRAFVMLNPDLDQKAFASLTRNLLSGTSGIRRVELGKGNVITHVFPGTGEPGTGEDERVGLRLMTDFPESVRDVISRAMKTRERQISTPTTLFQGGEAIISATPVYLPGKKLAGSHEYWGIILMLIDTGTLYREAGMGKESPSLDIALRKPGKVPGQNTMLHGKGAVFDTTPVIMNVPIPDGYWQIAAVPTGGWPVSPNRQLIVYGGGGVVLVLTSLLTATLYFLLSGIKNREKYRYLIQNAKSIILRIDMTGNITFCNEHAERFFGFEPGELLGRPLVGTLVPEKSLDGEPMKRYINRLLLNPSAHPFNETINTRKNGEMVWVAWANESVLGPSGAMVELLCVGTDITDRKLMEEALKHSEKQHRLLAENVTDIIMGLDADRRFTYVSPSDEALRGFGRYDVLGRPIGDFMTAQSERAFTRSIDALIPEISNDANPPSITLDLEFICADDSTVWLETRFGLLLNEKAELIGVQGVGRDISDRRRAEELRDDVERMARHDLKTPLAAVVGLPDEIRRLGELDAAQDGMLSTIREAGENMLELINRSLDLFKMESGAYVLEKTQVDVLQMLESIKNETRSIVREKGISVGVDVEEPLAGDTFLVSADEPLFRSMLSNLMINAFQASPTGGTVTVALAHSNDVTITVRNKGEVPQVLREKFFDKYASSEKSRGSGLGTYSARLIARTHGGDITVETCVPGETCVIVTLPA